MKRLTIALIACLLVLTALAPVGSAQDAVEVYPMADGATFTAEEGEEISLFWAWAATTPGLVRSFGTAVETSYLLVNGEGDVVWSLGPSSASALFGTPFAIPDEVLGLTCAQEDMWIIPWTYLLPGMLDPGSYTLTTTFGLTHPVNDGFHTCSFMGERIPPPSLYRAGKDVSVVSIEVVPAP